MFSDCKGTPKMGNGQSFRPDFSLVTIFKAADHACLKENTYLCQRKKTLSPEGRQEEVADNEPFFQNE